MNAPEDRTTKFLTKPWVSAPAGSARARVRGLAASMVASASRLNDIAAERAATMATTIHKSWRPVGMPPAANIAPQSANGRANTECSHLIISRVTRRFVSSVTSNGRTRSAELCSARRTRERPSITFGSDQRNETASLEYLDNRLAIQDAHQLQLLRMRRPDWNHHPSIVRKLVQKTPRYDGSG